MAVDFQKVLSGLSIKPKVILGTGGTTGSVGSIDKAAEDKTLKEGLDEIDNSLRPGDIKEYDLPDSLNQEKLKYDAPDDEQLKSQAEASLTEYYINSKGDIEKKAGASEKNLQEYLMNVQKNAEEKERNIAQLYDEAKSGVAGEALKRGLARSSIVLNQIEGLTKQQVESIEAVRNGVLDETAQIELNIAELKTEQESALRNLDITYASKLAMQIADLTDKRDEKMFEVQKYNNQIAEKEQKYIIDKLKAEQDLKLGEYDLIKKDIQTATSLDGEIDDYRQKVKYEYIMDYLSGLSKAEAIKLAEQSSDIKDGLNTYYYRRLINALEAR